jgi:hypothetical protein
VVARVALICIVESFVVILLGLQVFSGDDPPGDGTQHPRTLRSRSAPNAIQGTPAGEASAPKLTTATDVATRQKVVARWNADDPVGVLLTGTLHLRDGGPVDATITATLDKERKYARTKDGTYALLGLHPGEWRIVFRADAIVKTEHTLAITDDAIQHRDFVLDPSFAVRVMIMTPDGKDATRALRMTMSGWSEFKIAGQREPFPKRFAPTDYGAVFAGDARWDGEMNPKAGFAGTLHLASVPAHVALLQRHLVLEQQVVKPGQKDMKFIVDVEKLKQLAGSATVRVLDADSGAPLTTATVSLGTANRGGGGRRVDEQGIAVLDGLSPGLLLCRIRARDHENYFHTVRVEPGQRLDLGEVRLGAPQPLTGTVLDPDGKPAGAQLGWTELKWRSTPAKFSHNRVAGTEADGTFSLWGTGRGTIAVQARGAGGLLAAGVFDNPPTVPIVLRLAEPCECIVTRPPDPTRAFTITLFDGRKRAIGGYALEPRHAKRTISLPSGSYTFEVHDEQDRLVQTGSLRFDETPCKLEVR